MRVAKELHITLTGSMIGKSKSQRETLRALGFRRREQTVIHKDNPAVRGAIQKVRHVVDVKEVDA